MPPVWSFRNRTLRHVAPPSVLLKMPRSSFGTPCWPNAATYTMSAFVGWTRIFEMFCASLKPMCFHDLPASVDLYMPSPGMMLPRMHDSPVPMNTMSGLLSATATAPTEALVICLSVTGAHVSPRSVVFQSPPPVAPK